MFTEWTDSKNPGKSNRTNDAALVPGRLQEILSSTNILTGDDSNKYSTGDDSNKYSI